MKGYKRFRWLNFKLKIFRSKHHRNREIEFVLKHLADLSWVKFYGDKTMFKVLDMGCTDSLLLYEIEKRGYIPIGIDIRPYQTKIPDTCFFFQGDVTEPQFKEYFNKIKLKVYYIIALSTIEHIGTGGYGDKRVDNGDRVAMENLHTVLHDDGYFIITVPTKMWQSTSGRGYTPKEFEKLIEGLYKIMNMDIIDGQICAVLTKLV
jgi:SAM-dependent methyltransferase